MIADTLESLIRYAQRKLSEEAKSADDKTMAISCSGLFRSWKRGVYETGDIRVDPDNGYPYECIAPHDSIVNTGDDYTIKNRALWKPYHSRSPQWALPWEAPTGAHDMYRSGEYMVWTDGRTYLCVEDTNYSPEEYPQAWSKSDEKEKE